MKTLEKLLNSITLFLVVTLSFTNCTNKIPNWLSQSNHIVSRDGNAYVYQNTTNENGSYHISIGTWINASTGTGGAGILDLKCSLESNLKMAWLSDSVVSISYPNDCEVLRKEKTTNFCGRKLYFKYKITE